MVTIIEDTVKKVSKANTLFQLATTGEKTVTGKTVIYAAGRHPRKLNVPGEDELKNKGVSYCATCDAPLFAGKTVAVVGGGNTGAEAVIMLQKIAQKIYLLHIDDTLRADSILVENFMDDPKVDILYRATTVKIEGKQAVEKLIYNDEKTGEKKTIAVDGVFIAIGAIPNTEPVKELLPLDAFGAIPTDRYGVTKVPGFFAAGDVTDIRDAQIVVAAGHGCSAALSAGDYLSRTAVKAS
jgi:thioredoxin reductase